MASPTSEQLPPLNTQLHNQSTISVQSAATTVHSIITYGSLMSRNKPIGAEGEPYESRLTAWTNQAPSSLPKPSLLHSQNTKKNRHDSGYGDNEALCPLSSTATMPTKELTGPLMSTSKTKPRYSRRNSTPTATTATDGRPQSPLRTPSKDCRPSPKRFHTYASSVPQRLPLRTIHGSAYPLSHQTQTEPLGQYFQIYPPTSLPSASFSAYASHSSIASSPEGFSSQPSTPPPPPPPTCHYWTSDRTRRLEYAAIDAASRGLRGFALRVIPDCFLRSKSVRNKRCKFWCEGRKKKVDSDGGSVRRYRLDIGHGEGDEGSDEGSDDDRDEALENARVRRKVGLGWSLWRRSNPYQIVVD